MNNNEINCYDLINFRDCSNMYLHENQTNNLYSFYFLFYECLFIGVSIYILSYIKQDELF